MEEGSSGDLSNVLLKEGSDCVVRQKVGVVFLRDLGLMMTGSNLLQFRWRKLDCIQDLFSVRQLVSVELAMTHVEDEY